MSAADDENELRGEALATRFGAASALVASVRDVVDERVTEDVVPQWSEARGWTSSLLRLSDEALAVAEREGLGAVLERDGSAPPTLRELARAVRDATDLPRPPASDAIVARRRASPRKLAQLAGFAAAVEGLAPDAARLVDLGSGHGHLTRHLAAELGLSAEGWERDPGRVSVAAGLTDGDAVRFVALDAREAAASLAASDLVVGLHACGALGDLAIDAASRAGAAVLVVGCCAQKREGARRSLTLPDDDALVLGREVLGLANLREGEVGVEAPLAVRLEARARRLALRTLLRRAGAPVAAGEEMRGLNRRRAERSLDALVSEAFRARGLSSPASPAIVAARTDALAAHARMRRLDLPRVMLARLLEVWIALDRAALLASRGYDAALRVAFEAAVSPRNLAVLGREASRRRVARGRSPA